MGEGALPSPTLFVFLSKKNTEILVGVLLCEVFPPPVSAAQVWAMQTDYFLCFTYATCCSISALRWKAQLSFPSQEVQPRDGPGQASHPTWQDTKEGA